MTYFKLRISLCFVLAAPAMALAEPVERANYEAPAAEQAAELQRIRHIIRSRGNNPAAVAQLLQLTHDLPAATAAQLFDEVAADQFAVGEIDLAAEYRHTLVRRFGQTPAAEHAILWLVRFYASGEVAYAHRKAKPGKPVAEVEGADEPTFLRPENFGMLVYAKSLASDVQREYQKGESAAALVWQQATAERLSGRANAAQGLLTKLKHRPAGDLWRQRTRAEEWLREGGLASEDSASEDSASKVPAPAGSRYCARTPEPPYLDGALEEPCWTKASSEASPKGRQSQTIVVDPATTVQLACDDEYLYVAIRAEKLPGTSYRAEKRPRPRDAELAREDRVRLSLDVDRDYASAFELTVDHRGWTQDACWGDVTWNPEWFVAAESFNNRWQVEAAIPWKSLTAKPPTSGAAWSIAAERLLPDAVKAPAKFDLLLFE